MTERKEYELTQDQFDRIMKASNPVPYIVVGGTEPTSPREYAEREWRAVGKELGFLWLTAQPIQGKGNRFFTAEPATPAQLALITPCPVCGSIDSCPHTPVRCDHDYAYSEVYPVVGSTRMCGHCGRVEKAALDWVTVKA